jgi:large subunit ribosomal protein L30e
VEVSKELGRAVRSGKVVIGTKRSLNAIKRGEAKLVIVATNCPPDVLSDVDYYTKLVKVPVHRFGKDGRELGLACGKPFTVSMVAVVNPGSSDILSAVTRR